MNLGDEKIGNLDFSGVFFEVFNVNIINLFQKCFAILDVGARESLSDVVSKVLKKILSQPEGKEEELDDTLLT